MNEPGDRSEPQLSALAGVDALLSAATIDYWLFGGWAVDFHAGTVTRPHDDVDIAVWLDDHARIAELLEARGWRHAPYPDEDGGTGYERDGVRLELTFLVRREDERLYMPFGSGYVRWPDETLPGSEVEVLGTRARVVGLAALAEMKSSPREDADDAEKDRADLRVLRSTANYD
jgi:Aminoglycoside-2''-adenylyltransferase